MADESVVQCPNCGAAAPLPPHRAGWVNVTCPACGQSFPVAPPAGPSAAAPPPMPVGQPYAQPGAAYAPPGQSPLGYGAPQPQGMSTKKVVLIVLACVIGLGMIPFTCLMVGILLPSLNRAREQANRVKCASNLRQIGQAVMMYANANRGEFPDAIEKVLIADDVDSTCFVCPSSNDTAAPGSGGKAQAANLFKGGHMSYVYVGKGMDYRAGQTSVVAHEVMTNHNNDGINVLFGDGHVEFVARARAQKLIADVQAGINPPNLRGNPVPQ